jgi:hypothetical protein
MAVPQNLYCNGIVIIVLKTVSSKMRETNKYIYINIYIHMCIGIQGISVPSRILCFTGTNSCQE